LAAITRPFDLRDQIEQGNPATNFRVRSRDHIECAVCFAQQLELRLQFWNTPENLSDQAQRSYASGVAVPASVERKNPTENALQPT
jgi:hypothetical protein